MIEHMPNGNKYICLWQLYICPRHRHIRPCHQHICPKIPNPNRLTQTLISRSTKRTPLTVFVVCRLLLVGFRWFQWRSYQEAQDVDNGVLGSIILAVLGALNYLQTVPTHRRCSSVLCSSFLCRHSSLSFYWSDINGFNEDLIKKRKMLTMCAWKHHFTCFSSRSRTVNCLQTMPTDHRCASVLCSWQSDWINCDPQTSQHGQMGAGFE